MRAVAAAIGLALLAAACGPEDVGDGILATPQLSSDGSSTVFPIAEAMAESFQLATGIRVSAGQSGTGGGFKKFCRGEIDIAAASRAIKESEMQACAEAGIAFIELPVALDALAVVVNPSNDWANCLTVEELAKAWGPDSEGKVTSWAQIREGFPNAPLTLYGPGVDSGTFDYFTDAVNGEEGASRTDFTATEDDNVIIQGVSGDRAALGYMGIAYAEAAGSRIRKVEIRRPEDGVCAPASIETARSGEYRPLTRPLFFYVSKASADQKPHVRQFVRYVFDPANAELIREVGYVPMPEASYPGVLKRFEDGVTGHAPGDLAALIRGAAPTAKP